MVRGSNPPGVINIQAMVRKTTMLLYACLTVPAGGVQAAAGGMDWVDSALPTVRLSTDLRARYEFVDDAAFDDNAHALTIRMHTALEAQPHRHLVGLVEFEGIVAPLQTYSDGVQEREGRPVIPDAQTAELNRLQLRTDILPKTEIVVGRQRLSLDDERFVGRVAFRQNDQTYDAVRVVTNPFAQVVLEMAYVWQVNRIFGRRSDFGQFEGNSALFHLSAPTPAGQVSAFHYALDLETGPADQRTNTASSRTSGIRIAGQRKGKTLGVGWEAAYAHQQDHGDNPIDGHADYILGGFSLSWHDADLSVRYEALGAGTQGFQTPLGTLHAFQGDADRFTVTPPGGVRDLSGALSWAFGDLGPVRGLKASMRYHRFRSDETATALGEELNASLRAVAGGTSLAVEYAGYRARSFATDHNRLWLTAQRSF